MEPSTTIATPPRRPEKWVKVIDHTRCIGCHACTTACKSENEVPLSVTRTYVKYVDTGTYPDAQRAFQVTRCNQCDDAPCVTACPTSAMFRRPDGIVDFDKAACIGCKACIAACPYDAIFINPEDHSAEKCNFCAHRLDVGLEPACVVVCPTEAILVGDMNDPLSAVSRIVNRDAVSVRRPEKETRPKLFYKGASHATLDPIAARRPDGGLFMWSEQGDLPGQVTSGHPGAWNNSAAAVLSYDVPHRAPWDWRVSLYTWTKGIATGAYLVPLLLIMIGALGGMGALGAGAAGGAGAPGAGDAAGVLPGWSSPLWLWAAPVLGGFFLAATGALLIGDLEHPRRFHFIFTRPQWRSWLVRGAVLISGYGAVLALHFAAALAGRPVWTVVMALAGAPLAIGTAAYTAYLFAQAKARDLWQSPLAPPHLVVQAGLAGAAALLPLALWVEPAAAGPLAWVLAISAAVHLLFVLGEESLTRGTAHARLAGWEMTHGRYRAYFRAGVALVLVGLAAPWIGVWAAAPALLGLLAHEHAYVQAGQAVPLA